MSDEVIVRRQGDDVSEVVINRPDARNALDWETWRQLSAALAELRDDPATRGLLISGSADFFSGGGDLKSSGSAGSGVLASTGRLELAHRVITEIYRFPKPTIAAVEGAAVGVAWGMVLACDFVVAAKDASFNAPFVLRGYAPDGGVGWFLARALGRHRTLELLLLADRLGAPDAFALGLVTRLSEPGLARAEAISLASRVMAASPDAIRLTRGSVRQAMNLSLAEYLDDEALRVALALSGPDALEGRAAFAERRPPKFRQD